MKFINFFVMLLLICTSLTATQENNFYCLDDYQQDWKAGQIGSKIYLKKEALHLTDEEIFLIVGQKAIPLETIEVDHNGIFTYEAAYGLGWQCRCGYFNGESYNTCQNCFRIRP